MPEFRYQVVTTNKELNDAYQVREIVFMIEQQVPKNLEMDEHDETATHFVVYDDFEPVAAARIRTYTDNTIAKVERVAVLKKHRGTGVGKSLMNLIEKEALNQGYTAYRLNSQRHAEKFYSKLGYDTISEPFDEAGIEHVTMEKKIEE